MKPYGEEPIPPFADSYAKARKSYGLFSGILLAWELIGIEFGSTPIENLKVTLLSPQAIPYALIALVLYFAFRITIEWHQTDVDRRKILASRIDFTVAHIIGTFSLLLYAIQNALKIQIANKFSTPIILSVILGIAIEQVLIPTYSVFNKSKRLGMFFSVLILFGFISFPFWLPTNKQGESYSFLLIYVTITTASLLSFIARHMIILYRDKNTEEY